MDKRDKDLFIIIIVIFILLLLFPGRICPGLHFLFGPGLDNLLKIFVFILIGSMIYRIFRSNKGES